MWWKYSVRAPASCIYANLGILKRRFGRTSVKTRELAVFPEQYSDWILWLTFCLIITVTPLLWGTKQSKLTELFIVNKQIMKKLSLNRRPSGLGPAPSLELWNKDIWYRRLFPCYNPTHSEAAVIKSSRPWFSLSPLTPLSLPPGS